MIRKIIELLGRSKRKQDIENELLLLEESISIATDVNELRDLQTKKIRQIKNIKKDCGPRWLQQKHIDSLKAIAVNQKEFLIKERKEFQKEVSLLESISRFLKNSDISTQLNKGEKEYIDAPNQGIQKLRSLIDLYTESTEKDLLGLIEQFNKETSVYDDRKRWKNIFSSSFESELSMQEKLIEIFLQKFQNRASEILSLAKASYQEYVKRKEEQKLADDKAYEERVRREKQDAIKRSAQWNRFVNKYISACRTISFAEQESEKFEEVLNGELATYSIIIIPSYGLVQTNLNNLEKEKPPSYNYVEETDQEYQYLYELSKKIQDNTPMKDVLARSPFISFRHYWIDPRTGKENQEMTFGQYLRLLERNRITKNHVWNNQILYRQLLISLQLKVKKVIVYRVGESAELYHERIHRTFDMHKKLRKRFIDVIYENKLEQSDAYRKSRSLRIAPGYDYDEDFVVQYLTQKKFNLHNDLGYPEIDFPSNLVQELEIQMKKDRKQVYETNIKEFNRLKKRVASLDKNFWENFM